MNSKHLPPNYWIERNKAMRSGEITAKQLIQESADYLKSLGFIYNPVLGWIPKEDLKELRMDENQNSVPVRIEEVKGKKVKRINYLFSQYLDKKNKEEWDRIENRKDAESLIETAGEVLEPPF